MGAAVAEEARAVDFYVTGFGPFHSVAANPSGEVVRLLPARLALERAGAPATGRAGGPATVRLAGAEVLEVSAAAVGRYLAGAAEGDALHLHLGVDVSAKRFRLERRAVNEVHFTCPDQQGWQPCHQPIDASGGRTAAAALETGLPVAKLVDQLRGKGFQVEESHDAGRFVCNYTYYTSLDRCARVGGEALFLHVPSAKTTPVRQQLDFVVALMEALAVARVPAV